MKETFKTIKEHFILLFGTGLFIYGLFGFDSGYYCGEGSLIPAGTLPLQLFERFKCIEPTTHYYYNDTNLILLTIGAIFITIGLLKLKKYERKN